MAVKRIGITSSFLLLALNASAADPTFIFSNTTTDRAYHGRLDGSVITVIGSAAIGNLEWSAPLDSENVAMADSLNRSIHVYSITGELRSSTVVDLVPNFVSPVNSNTVVTWNRVAQRGEVVSLVDGTVSTSLTAPTGSWFEGVTYHQGSFFGVSATNGRIHRWAGTGGTAVYISAQPISNVGAYGKVPTFFSSNGYMYASTRDGGNSNGAAIRRFVPNETPEYDALLGSTVGYRFCDQLIPINDEVFLGHTQDGNNIGSYLSLFSMSNSTMRFGTQFLPSGVSPFWNHRSLSVLPPVPEPGTMTVLLGGVLFAARRKRTSKTM